MQRNDSLDPEAALVLFSGGQDSATALAWALARYKRVETVGFDYGQRHSVELKQRPLVRAMIAELNSDWRDRLGQDVVIDLAGFGAIGETALTTEAEIGFAATGLPTTFVPARNLTFFSTAGALGYRRGLGRLVAGVCETDYSGYPDCRAETVEAMQRALALGLDADIAIDAPLMHLSKAATWDLAKSLGGEALIDVIVEHTHSCYRGVRAQRHDWGYGCGECPACELRARGWREFAGAETGA